VRLEGSSQLKKSGGLIGNQTRDLLACNITPQPTTLMRDINVLNIKETHKISVISEGGNC
jgi:hypothetical protein